MACATDHVIRSFRNDLYAGYKTEEGVPSRRCSRSSRSSRRRWRRSGSWSGRWSSSRPTTRSPPAPRASRREVEQVLIATPDKDLAQCVRGQHVVMLDRRRKKTLDEEGVRAKYGVPPRSIPDWLALVGDTADGYPGLPGWGARSAAAVLAGVRHDRGDPGDARRAGT